MKHLLLTSLLVTSTTFATPIIKADLKCAISSEVKISNFIDLDLKSCKEKGILEHQELERYIIAHVEAQGNALEAIRFVPNLTNEAISEALNSEYLSEKNRSEIKQLLSNPNLESVDAFYVIDNYYGGTGEVTYLVIRDLDHYVVSIVPILTYAE